MSSFIFDKTTRGSGNTENGPDVTKAESRHTGRKRKMTGSEKREKRFGKMRQMTCNLLKVGPLITYYNASIETYLCLSVVDGSFRESSAFLGAPWFDIVIVTLSLRHCHCDIVIATLSL